MPIRRSQRNAMTLLEVLLVVAMMAILAGLALPNANPTIVEQLRSAANTVAADLAYARSQAVTYGSDFRIRFSTASGEYTIEHAGSNPALDDVLHNPFDEGPSWSAQYVVALAELPGLGPQVRLAAVARIDSQDNPAGSVSDIVFGPLGETSRPQNTRIWLAAGHGSALKTISVHVNSVTGLATVEPPGLRELP
jgi:prepilin-type N-terminal cleavage/methylation domain-containing protein